MQQSILKIFKNMNIQNIIIFLLSLFILLFFIEKNISNNNIQAFNSYERILHEYLEKSKDKNSLKILDYNAKMATIYNEIDAITQMSKYYYLSSAFLKDFKNHNLQLLKLKQSIQKYDSLLRVHFDSSDKKKVKQRVLEIEKAFYEVNKNINIYVTDALYLNNERFTIYSKAFYLLFFLTLLNVLWYKKNFDLIYKDIMILKDLDSSKDSQINTIEIDSIALRMKRKSSASDDPSMLDPVTNIYNDKGMIQAYSEKKKSKNNSFSSVTVLEIDNFSKNNRPFTQELTQDILKKVAYSLSLHKQAGDIIARTDYNQFTLIYARSNKAELFKDTDLLRQSISEIKFLNQNQEKIQVTVSGGFVEKSTNNAIEESIKRAKELLQHAQKHGNNKIIQIKDLPK